MCEDFALALEHECQTQAPQFLVGWTETLPPIREEGARPVPFFGAVLLCFLRNESHTSACSIEDSIIKLL